MKWQTDHWHVAQLDYASASLNKANGMTGTKNMYFKPNQGFNQGNEAKPKLIKALYSFIFLFFNKFSCDTKWLMDFIISS